jgi:hypothetical protein
MLVHKSLLIKMQSGSIIVVMTVTYYKEQSQKKRSSSLTGEHVNRYQVEEHRHQA